MARYLVTSDSNFTPFTYDEMAKPLVQMAEAQNKTQDAYDKLVMDSAAIKNYITNNPEDSDAKVMYDNYMEKLQKLQNDLWQNGYSAQARRNLTEARQGYASDINRITDAIKMQQKLQEAIGDARRKNPDLVTSDPNEYRGLNNFLRDSAFGQDWYQYDSSKLEKGVGDEWKQRARELLSTVSDPNVVSSNPNLPNILTRVLGQGLTNAEVRNAGLLADVVANLPIEQRKQYYQDNRIDELSQILVESLLSRYDATGINQAPNMTDAEKRRLFERGKAGWSAGIFAPAVKDFTDPASARVYGGSGSGGDGSRRRTSGDGEDNYSIADYDELEHHGVNASAAASDTEPYLSSTRSVVRPDKSKAELAMEVYGYNIRKPFLQMGIDITQPERNQFGAMTAGDKTYPVKIIDGKFYVDTGGRGTFNRNDAKEIPAWTQRYQDAVRAYQTNLSKYDKETLNELKDLAPNKVYKLYKRYGIPMDTSLTEAAGMILNQRDSAQVRKMQYYRYSTTADNAAYNKDFAKRLTEYLSSADTSHKIYSFDTVTGNRDTKAIKNIDDVLTLPTQTDSGQEAKYFNNIQRVTVSFDSLFDGPVGHFIVFTDKGVFSVDASAFGGNAIKGYFAKARNAVRRVQEDPSLKNADPRTRAAIYNSIMTDLFNDIRRGYAYDIHRKREGDSGKSED